MVLPIVFAVILFLQASSDGTSFLSQNLLAIAAVISAVMTPLVVIILALINKKVNGVASKVDGITTELIKTKSTEAHALGVKEATDAIGKEKAASDSSELRSMKDQALKQPPK